MIYNLFISHSWAYRDEYERLIMLLDGSNLEYRNYSVPWDDPIEDVRNDRQLREAIKNQIRPASCVLILAGVYSTFSEWINTEIDIAQELGKPIIAVEPWGSERTSAVVKDNADYIVRWNTDSIVNAIIDSHH